MTKCLCGSTTTCLKPIFQKFRVPVPEHRRDILSSLWFRDATAIKDRIGLTAQTVVLPCFIGFLTDNSSEEKKEHMELISSRMIMAAICLYVAEKTLLFSMHTPQQVHEWFEKCVHCEMVPNNSFLLSEQTNSVQQVVVSAADSVCDIKEPVTLVCYIISSLLSKESASVQSLLSVKALRFLNDHFAWRIVDKVKATEIPLSNDASRMQIETMEIEQVVRNVRECVLENRLVVTEALPKTVMPTPMTDDAQAEPQAGNVQPQQEPVNQPEQKPAKKQTNWDVKHVSSATVTQPTIGEVTTNPAQQAKAKPKSKAKRVEPAAAAAAAAVVVMEKDKAVEKEKDKDKQKDKPKAAMVVLKATTVTPKPPAAAAAAAAASTMQDDKEELDIVTPIPAEEDRMTAKATIKEPTKSGISMVAPKKKGLFANIAAFKQQFAVPKVSS